MTKSTFRILIVLLLGVLVVFIAKGYFKLTLLTDGHSVVMRDAKSDEIQSPKGELMQSTESIGFKYKTENSLKNFNT